MGKIPLFSVVVCTYNRKELLRICLETLCRTPVSSSLNWELIVIDNNSPDKTADTVKEVFEQFPEITAKYILETKQGLSNARNRGYVEANSEWVMYLDDDAKVRENFLDRTAFLINETSYQIIGGVFYPWYHFGKPEWYKDRYGSNAQPIDKLSVPGGGIYACGGVMIWNRDLLENLGGFDPNVGMNGDVIAYGEETFLQKKAQKIGVEIAYDPELVIYHVVAPYKLDMDWFFKSNYAAGRDRMLGGQVSKSLLSLFLQLLIGSAVLVKDLLLNTPKLLFKSDYYTENWLIDTFRKAAKRIGIIYTGLKLRS